MFVLFLAIVAPLIDGFYIPKIKRVCNQAKRRRHYVATIVTEWVMAGVAVWCLGTTAIWSGSAAVLAGRTALGRPLTLIPILLVAGALLTLACKAFFRSFKKPSIRDSYARAISKSSFRFLFPTTVAEIRWFALLSVSAGICEEVVYRSFLINYFFAGPFHLALPLAFALSAVLFGIAHAYQGWGGIIQTAIYGAVVGLLFLATGSLLLVIVVHTFVDLQVVFMLRPGWESRLEPSIPTINSRDDQKLESQAAVS